MIIVTMIVKNEERCIRKALESVREADRVCILDTGSTDKTGEIAQSFPNVDFIEGVYKWNDDTSEARNKALALADGADSDWFYTLDADEWLVPGAFDVLSSFAYTTKMDRSILAASVKIVSSDGRKVHSQPRMFRAGMGIGWRGMWHPVLVDLKSGAPVNGAENLGEIHVYGYSPNHALDRDRYLRIGGKALERDGRTPRNLFYIARELSYHQRWAEAEAHYREYLAHKDSRWTLEINEARLQLARCLWFQNKGSEARQLCLQLIGADPEMRSALNLMADMTYQAQSKAWRRYAEIATDENSLFSTRG